MKCRAHTRTAFQSILKDLKLRLVQFIFSDVISLSDNTNNNSQNHNPTDPSGLNPEPRQSRTDRLKSAQSLITAAMICGPVSLIVGGVLLSTIAVICASLAYWKLRDLDGLKNPESLEYRLRRQAIFLICICVLALILNTISFVQVMPLVFEALQSGDYTSVLGSSAGYVASSSSASSVWG